MASLKDQIKDLKITKRRKLDRDPEDDPYETQSASSEASENEWPKSSGREHYESVGKSRIRRLEQEPLDAKYAGAAVRRAELNGDIEEDHDDDPFAPVTEIEDDDPFAAQSAQDDVLSNESQEFPDDVNVLEIGGDDDDQEIDSDEAFGEGDSEKFKNFMFRGSKAHTAENGRSGLSDETNSNMSREESVSESSADFDDDLGSDTADEMKDQGDDEPEESENEQSDDPDMLSNNRNTKREQLKALLSGDAAAVASTLSQAASSDAKKGSAVKQQYQTFDRLLDARIKLQKGLASANEFSSPASSSFHEEAESALQKAEEAALRLYSTIESLRIAMLDVGSTSSEVSTKKRKRTGSRGLNTPVTAIWSDLSKSESEAVTSRRTVLDKWSNKIKASDPVQAASSAKSRFLNEQDARQQSRLSAVIDTYLLSEGERLVSEATLKQVARTSDKDDSEPRETIPTYDDNAFYQSLLRELINSRSATSDSSFSNAGNLQVPILPMKLHPSGNKSRQKVVETRGSKGRKVRYTVHEKLQNFMAAEGDNGRDTSQWTEAAKTEFFGSLLGQSRALDEDEDIDMHDVNGREGLSSQQNEVEALRLFRS